jgi:predicted nucleotidyltransferase
MNPLDLSTILAKQIGVFPHVEKVMLFGSHARGDARSGSDIDLAVIASGADEDEWTLIKAMRESPITLRKIDIIRYDKPPPALREVIDQEGVVLFARQVS